jgi:uncharacterized DUF497 family protein
MAQISTAAHQSTSSNRWRVMAFSFNQCHLAVLYAANQLIINPITANINIQSEFTSFGSENLSMAFLMMNALHVIRIITVIKAHKIENLAYP